MWLAAASGFALGLGLIVAIGAQNAYVIRQGVLNAHVFWICCFCAISDAVLICAGTFGLAAVLVYLPLLEQVMRWGGALFLLWYGIKALRRALAGSDGVQATGEVQSLKSALLLCAAFTWANPHVYLDTVALVGAIANARPAGEQFPFAMGASFASLLWFFALGYGAKALRGPLSKPIVWRGLDFAIAAIMFALSVSLFLGH